MILSYKLCINILLELVKRTQTKNKTVRKHRNDQTQLNFFSLPYAAEYTIVGLLNSDPSNKPNELVPACTSIFQE